MFDLELALIADICEIGFCSSALRMLKFYTKLQIMTFFIAY